MHLVKGFREEHLRQYGYSGTNFTAMVNCTNLKTGILSEIIETQIMDL